MKVRTSTVCLSVLTRPSTAVHAIAAGGIFLNCPVEERSHSQYMKFSITQLLNEVKPASVSDKSWRLKARRLMDTNLLVYYAIKRKFVLQPGHLKVCRRKAVCGASFHQLQCINWNWTVPWLLQSCWNERVVFFISGDLQLRKGI